MDGNELTEVDRGELECGEGYDGLEGESECYYEGDGQERAMEREQTARSAQ